MQDVQNEAVQLPAENTGLDLLLSRYELKEGLQSQILIGNTEVTGYVKNNKVMENAAH